MPVKARIKDKKSGTVKEVIVEMDDGVRAETTAEGLAKLKPAFDPKGTTTAGNASQVSDGAAAVLVASRAYAEKNKLPILGTFRSFAVTGVPPDVMGIGPATAIPEAVKKAGLSLNDIDVFEINEAFASQALYCVRKLGLDEAKVNPNGGAIALGHALGCTGARQTATLMQELKRRNARFGVVSMCIGSGKRSSIIDSDIYNMLLTLLPSLCFLHSLFLFQVWVLPLCSSSSASKSLAASASAVWRGGRTAQTRSRIMKLLQINSYSVTVFDIFLMQDIEFPLN